MKKIPIIATLLFLYIIPLQAQLLWKISGKGLTQPSYVFGTNHLSKLSILDKIQGYKAAFESTRQVVGEVETKDIQSPSTVMLMQKKMMINNDTTFKMLFSSEDYARVEKCITENIPMMNMSMIQKICPAFLTNQLSVVLYMKQVGNIDMSEQLDSYFQKEGESKGKTIIGLETYEQQFDLLWTSQPLKRQAELLVCLVDNFKEEAEKEVKISKLYESQDLNGMFKLAEEKDGTKCDSYPTEEARLIFNRNRAWMNELPTMINKAPTFIAVGALHLAGPEGLLSLLKKAGYTITPVK